MAIEEGLWARLTGSPDVWLLAERRVYPAVIPQDAPYPAVAYQRISTVRDLAHDGPAGMALARFQVTCVAETYAQARALANAVRETLDGFRGEMSGTTVHECAIENDVDDYNEVAGTWEVRADYMILHNE